MLLFIQCKGNSKNKIKSSEKVIEDKQKVLKTLSKSENNPKTSKDTILIKLENLKVIVEVANDEKEEIIIEYERLESINNAGNVYEKKDTISLNSEYAEIRGISILNDKQVSFELSENLHELGATITYVVGIGYGYDRLGGDMPSAINEYSYNIKESISFNLSSNNKLKTKNEDDLISEVLNQYFIEIRQKIYSHKKELYTKLINDKSSLFYKDEYYKKSMEKFLSKKIEDVKNLEDLDAFMQIAYIVFEFKGRTINGEEFQEFLGG